jgi:hypothetical protein
MEVESKRKAPPEPNKYLIMLRASAIRMHWSPARERQARGSIATGWVPMDASQDFCRLVSDRCRRGRPPC